MSVVFRCDAGSVFGLGHLSRCIVLANSLSRNRVGIRFAINAPEPVFKRILHLGYEVQVLPMPINIYEDPENWIGDAKFAFLDSPNINEEYSKKISSVIKVGFFDDDIARDYDVDLIINNHPWANDSDYPKNYFSRTLLLGTKFNTVDPEYFKIVDDRHGLLVTMGGEDPHNMTSMIIRELNKVKIDTPIIIVVGPSHPKPDDVSIDAKRYLPHAKLFFSPDSLVPFMKKTNIAITAGGTTCYELLASKIPFAVLALEHSQIRLSQTMDQFGFGFLMGKYNYIDPVLFRDIIKKLNNKIIIDSMIKKGTEFYPQTGVDYIADKINSLFY